MSRFKSVTPCFIILFIILYASVLSAQQTRFMAILPFNNNGSQDYQWVARGIEEILYDKLANLQHIEVFEKVTLDRILAENDVQSGNDLSVRKAFRLGKETGVDVLITGSYSVNGGNLILNIRVVSTYTGGDILKEAFRGSLTDIYQLHREAILKILQVMSLPVGETERRMLDQSSTGSITAFEYYCRAYIAFQNGASMEVVADYFANAIGQDPDFWEAQYNLGVIYYNFDRYEKALNQFEEVIRRNPGFYKPYYGMGVIFYLQRRYHQALQNFNKVLNKERDHDRTLYYLGRVYMRLDSIEKSLRYLQKSAELNPNYAPTQYYIGYVNMKRGWYKTAVQAFKKSLKLDPENARAHNALGQCYYNLQRFDEAIYEYKKAFTLRQDYSTAYFNLGNTIYKRGALEEIVDAYLEILETRYTKNGSGEKGSGIIEDIKKLRSETNVKSAQIYRKMISAYRKPLH